MSLRRLGTRLNYGAGDSGSSPSPTRTWSSQRTPSSPLPARPLAAPGHARAL